MSKLFGTIYRVVENPFEKDAGIELIGSEWKGLVYQYGDVQFVDGEAQINFQRSIRRLPEDVEETEENIEDLLNNSELNQLMGDILLELIDEQLEKDKYEQRVITKPDQET
jgi:hypothetical protein